MSLTEVTELITDLCDLRELKSRSYWDGRETCTRCARALMQLHIAGDMFFMVTPHSRNMLRYPQYFGNVQKCLHSLKID